MNLKQLRQNIKLNLQDFYESYPVYIPANLQTKIKLNVTTNFNKENRPCNMPFVVFTFPSWFKYLFGRNQFIQITTSVK